MQIGIAGLGLMGGSLAKAIKAHTTHKVHGFDINGDVEKQALADGAIDAVLGIEVCDLVFVCFYPKAVINYVATTAFKEGAIVADICGVKECLECLSDVSGIRYVGTHPMAGREVSGYFASKADLFTNASFIITTNAKTDTNSVVVLEELAKQIGFKQITKCTAKKHDKVIAYTSQLAHIVSNAYVKSETSRQFAGFSAGSFQDLTRVAKLNAKMWSELFLENADNLTEEIDTLIKHLEEIKGTIAGRDEAALERLLKEGSDIREGI